LTLGNCQIGKLTATTTAQWAAENRGWRRGGKPLKCTVAGN
jgi:hypothetical protein